MAGCVSGPPRQVHIQAPSSALFRAELLDPPSSRSFKVTTFNIWGLPKWLNGASSDRYAKIAKQLDQNGSDVVLLQEVWTHRSFHDLSEQLKHSTGAWWTASARNRGTFLGQNGLLTLSRYPIVGAEVKHFSTAHLPDSLMNKGALKVIIAVGSGQRFNIWNVHLQDGDPGKVRAHQIEEFIGWINEAHDDQVADIIGGDFNFTPDTTEFRSFVTAIGPDVHQLAGDKAFPTWDGLKLASGTAQALDHIFIRLRQPDYQIAAHPKRLFAAERNQDRLSDHMAMEASLTFRNTLETPVPALVEQGAQATLLESALISRSDVR